MIRENELFTVHCLFIGISLMCNCMCMCVLFNVYVPTPHQTMKSKMVGIVFNLPTNVKFLL